MTNGQLNSHLLNKKYSTQHSSMEKCKLKPQQDTKTYPLKWPK